MSGDPDQEYFADGMVEEIITALSRIRWLFVIARNSSFTYKSQAVDVKQIGRELGVRYVVEGSVRKGGNRVRIAAQLIEAESTAHLWADHFDGSLEDVLDLQDQVAISVAGVIEPALRAAEVRRAVDRPRPNPTAYDLYLRALRATNSWEKQDYIEALDRLSHVIEQDAAYGPALALSAQYNMLLYGNAWTDDPEATRQNAIWFARRAVRSAGADAETLGRAAFVLAYCGEDIDAATALVDSVITYQSELRRWMAMERVVKIMGGLARRSDRSFGEILTTQSTRFFSRDIGGDRHGPFLRAAPRPGADYVVAVTTTAPGLGTDEPVSRCVLRAPRRMGRGKNDDQTAARPDAGGAAEGGSLARSGAARVLPIGPAAGDESD